MSWGYKIVLAFLAFVVFLGILVYRTMNNKIDLVAEDYYEQELLYQDEIIKIRNARSLDPSVQIQLVTAAKQLFIKFPSQHKVKHGSLDLYRPSDAALDRKLELVSDQNNQFVLFIGDLASGLWQVKLEWQADSISYLQEQNIYLP